jgi:hypothetical protein
MNVLEARVVLRDRTLLDGVDLTLRFLVHYWKKYVALAAIVLPPMLLLSWGVAYGAGWGWGWTVALLLAPFVGAPFTALASRLLFEPTARVGEVLRATAAALPRLLAVRLLELCAIAVLCLFLVVPATWAFALFFFVNEVVVLEHASVGNGLARMQRLLSGQSADVVMALLFLTALHVVAVFLGDIVGRSLLEELLELPAPPSIFAAKGSVLALLSFWGFVPFGATCRFLLYINARTRTEGWDVQTRFAAIVARAATEASEASEASVAGVASRAPSFPGRAA